MSMLRDRDNVYRSALVKCGASSRSHVIASSSSINQTRDTLIIIPGIYASNLPMVGLIRDNVDTNALVKFGKKTRYVVP
jgi:hypothetical protein